MGNWSEGPGPGLWRVGGLLQSANFGKSRCEKGAATSDAFDEFPPHPINERLWGSKVLDNKYRFWEHGRSSFLPKKPVCSGHCPN